MLGFLDVVSDGFFEGLEDGMLVIDGICVVFVMMYMGFCVNGGFGTGFG